MNVTQVQMAAAVVVFGGLVGAVVIQGNQNQRLRAEIAQLNATIQSKETATAPASASENAASDEVVRLRGEVAKLIRERNDQASQAQQSAGTQSQAASAGTLTAAPQEDPREVQRRVALARLGYARNWGMAFFLYMEKHDGQMPATFAEAIQFLPKDDSVAGMTPDQYEITFQGRTADLANPSATFIMRERDPAQESAISRTYLFADGHTEIVKVDDGDFTAWEQQHMPVFREPNPSQPVAGQ